MFCIDENPEFSRKVKVLVPVNGGHETQDFTAVYRVLSIEEVEAFDLSAPGGVLDLLTRVLVRCEEIVDHNQLPVAWNDDIRRRLLSKPFTRSPLLTTYFDAINGAREGN